MLRVSGETLEGPRPSDLFEVVVDSQGDLTLVLLDVHAPGDSSERALCQAMDRVREALEAREPLHSAVTNLELSFAEWPGREAGIGLLRFSQASSRVEILNAGMPPIMHVVPGGHVTMHHALSTPVGRRVGEVHAYELVPLIWSGVWLIASDGFTNGSLDADPMRELSAKLAIVECGLELSAHTSAEFYDRLLQVPRARFLRDDATAIVVFADPKSRFESGFHPR
ncbi:MAG TPA: SpoIIE family protein phosphatase [Polyangiaceae bacterium]